MRTKAPPPFVPALYGNPHMLPNPTAEPVAARIKVHLPTHAPCDLSCFCISIIFKNLKGYYKG